MAKRHAVPTLIRLILHSLVRVYAVCSYIKGQFGSFLSIVFNGLLIIKAATAFKC